MTKKNDKVRNIGLRDVYVKKLNLVNYIIKVR